MTGGRAVTGAGRRVVRGFFRLRGAGLRMLRRIRRLPWLRGFRRRLGIRRADVCVVSFPKSGRTWFRFLLGRVLTQHFGAPARLIPHTGALHRLHLSVPRLLVTHDDFAHRKRPDEIEMDKTLYAGKRVVLLVRDPRDVLVSQYFQRRYRRRETGGAPLSISELVRGEVGGLRSLVAFYNAWARSRDVPAALLVVSYEQLRNNTAAELRRTLDFLGLSFIADDVLVEAIDYCSFANMKKMEREAVGRFSTGSWGKRDPTNPESFKVRKGKVGGYLDYLDAEDIGFVNSVLERELADLFEIYRRPPVNR